MADEIEVDFVLARGPSSIDRRMHVTLSSNGAPVTVGRSTHCSVLLDPSLLFSSQVHCSLCAMRVKKVVAVTSTSTTTSVTNTPLKTTDVPSTPSRLDAGGSAQHCGDTPIDAADALSTPIHQHTRDSDRSACVTRVYITDMCSSNGTFVNGIRISGTDPTELKHGDVCIFGGMRDVNVGDAIPEDAYEGPELVQWRVDLRLSAKQPPEMFEYTSTPLVLPARGVLEKEERELVETAQRSLANPKRTSTFTPSPAATTVIAAMKASSSSVLVEDSPACLSTAFEPQMGDSSPRSVPQQLFTSPGLGERDAARELSVAEVEKMHECDDNGRRSGSLVAPDEGHATSVEAKEESGNEADPINDIPTPLDDPVATAVPADPPTAIFYDLVRLGNVRYDARAERRGEGELMALEEARVEDEDVDPLPPSDKCRRCSSLPSTASQRQEWECSDKVHSAAVAALNQLTFTSTHFKWTMPNPNELWLRLDPSSPRGASAAPTPTPAAAAVASQNSGTDGRAAKTFYGMLPVTSLETLVACPERLGIAVELKDGCQLPLVDPAVLSGSAGSRWVVWVLSPLMRAAQAPAGEAQKDCQGRTRVTKGGAHKTNKTRENTVPVSAHGTPAAAPAAVVEKSLRTPTERFEEWLTHFTLYYAARNVPAPVVVDGATFDVISSVLSPPHQSSSSSLGVPPQ